MKFKTVFAASIAIIMFCGCSVAQPLSQREFSCPGVDANGERPFLGMGLSPAVTTAQEDSEPVPADLVAKTLPIIGFFESSSSDPYVNINGTDVISIGYLQWNWNSNSIFNTFFRHIKLSDIELASPPIKLSLQVLKGYASRSRSVSEEAARAAIQQLLSNKAAVRAWLGTAEVRVRQQAMMEPTLKLAYSYTRKWLQGVANPSGSDVLQTYVFFLDMVVYNGGRAGIWREQVDAFQVGKTPIQIAEQLNRWAVKCAAVVRNKPHSRMYSSADTIHNAEQWKEKIINFPSYFSKNQIDLLVFGYLRAIMSVGSNKPNGFPGIFAADVLSRRGTVALRIGKVHATCFVPDEARYVASAVCR